MPQTLTYIPYTILLLGILIFVHEMGHFLVAKALNVKVLKFSIGFGPAIFSFQRGETEYRVAWVPLGGYVKMAGELPYEELPPEEARRGFLAQPPWKRMLIVAAGPVFNLVFPVLVFFVVFLGSHQEISTRVGSLEPGMPAAEAGILPGDRVLAVDGEKVVSYGELIEQLQHRYDRPTPLTVERDGETFTVTLTPARKTDTDPLESTTRGLIGIRPTPMPPVLGVPGGSAAEAAGLRTFDRVVSISGKPVKDEHDLRQVTAGLSGALEVEVLRGERLDLPGVGGTNPRLVRVTVPRQEGEGYAALGAEHGALYLYEVLPDSPAAKIGLRPGDRLVAVNGVEVRSFEKFAQALSDTFKDQPFTLTWRSGAETRTAQVRQARSEEKDELGKVSGRLYLGVVTRPAGPEDALSPELITLRMGPWKALQRSALIVPEYIGKIAMVIGYLLTLKVPIENVGGPIMLHQMAARAAEEGVDTFLKMMALISINLGLMNLLPIPILDGFHLLAAAWEAIRRRPIPMRAREIANWVGLVLLVSLMVRVFYNDALRMLGKL
jgi:regulator of sigma E protease